MTSLNYWLDFITVPVAAGIAAVFATHEPSAFTGSFVAGWLTWIAAEYLIHREVFHHPKRMRRAHWRHHLHPTDMSPDAIVLPIYSSSLLLVAGLVAQLLADGWGLAWWSGLLVGYLSYITTHHAIHHGWLSTTGLLGGIARRHNLHHRGVEKNFNLLIPLGDLLCGTYVKA